MLRRSFSLKPSLGLTADDVCYQAYTLWLFTFNDLKTMVFPSTALGFERCILPTEPLLFFVEEIQARARSFLIVPRSTKLRQAHANSLQ